MKTTFKTLLAAVALLAAVVSASAQTYSFQSLGGLPATLATTVSTNLASPPIIDVRKQASVNLQFRFNQSSASTSNVVFTLQYSNDGSNWDTTRSNVITAASTGTTPVTLTTNVATGGVGYLRLSSIANTTALTTMTNLGIGYSIKIQAP